jgi:type II secretory pathway pseudopilin PulG
MKSLVKKISAAKASAAFTIVELIVVIGIFGIIMTTALANQQELNSSLLISNLAYEIGLISRETQAYGIGVRARPDEPNPQNFQGSFGMNIVIGDDGTTDQIKIFKDLPEANGQPDGRYTGDYELFSVYQFQNQRGSKIVALCYDGDGLPCKRGEGLGTGSADELNVVFKRPNPEATFNAIGEGLTDLVRGHKGPAIIVVNTAARKNCRAVVIEATGQIRVESARSSTPYCVNLP